MSLESETRSEVLTVRVTPTLRTQIEAAAWIESGGDDLSFQVSSYMLSALESHAEGVLASQEGGVAGVLERYLQAVEDSRMADLRAEIERIEAARSAIADTATD